ncbi:MAG: DUF817 domain-containing protein [Pseudomonadota bacterium]
MPPDRPPTDSAARLWPPLAVFIAREKRLSDWAAGRGPVIRFLYEFLRFGLKQGWACLFGGAMVALLIGTRLYYPAAAPLARYDFLVIAAIVLQIAMLASRLETFDELKVILLFHVVGTGMELFKTATGSWLYPEPGLLKIGGVPLFTGFMYGTIGSYIARAWRLFDFRFQHHPSLTALNLLALAIYGNFFADHYGLDFRYALFIAAAVLFWRTRIFYKVWITYRAMPLLLGFCLVALFIWFAENAGTAAHVWLYPNQLARWSLVALWKLGSWFLLMIISYVMVAWINRPRVYVMPPEQSSPEPSCAQPYQNRP